MPRLSDTTAVLKPIKMLFLGDSGTGKTGALASLANAGYNLRILDFDAGTDVLRSALQPQALERVWVETFTDKFKIINGKTLVDGVPSAFSNAMQLLDKWAVKDKTEKGLDGSVTVVPGYDLGPVKGWGIRDCLVIDSMTFAGMAAMRQVLAMNSRLGERPWPADYGAAQDRIEGMIQLLCSDSIRCNVVVNSHVNYYEVTKDSGTKDEKGKPILDVIDTKGLPMAVGQALSPKLPTYFNSTLIAFRKGQGVTEKRLISTRGLGIVEAKTANIAAPKEFPLETGLADFFKFFHGDISKVL